MLTTLGLAEWGAARMSASLNDTASGDAAIATPPTAEAPRPNGFFEFPQTAYPCADNRSSRPLVLVLGNSHTYTLPSPTPGLPMRIGGEGILPDELAQRLNAGRDADDVRFDVGLLSYPNFLPFEMLTRAVQLDLHGYRPQIVVLGLTWRNVARDSQLRERIREAFRDEELAERLRSAIRTTPVNAAPLDGRIDEALRRLAREAEVERLKSDADRIDERLFDAARSHLHLVGEAEELRSRLYRAIYGPLQTAWERRTDVAYSYSLVEADFRFNAGALRALLEWYAKRDVKVVVYLAPERDDLPPLMDPAEQETFFGELRGWVKPLGVEVLDARRVIPNELWGYDFDLPDRSHFALPGHQLLAEFLCDNATALRAVVAESKAQPTGGRAP